LHNVRNRASEKIMHLSRITWLVVGTAISAAGLVTAQDEPQSADEQAIRRNTQKFVEAFNAGDIQAMSALWTPGGDFVGENGQTIHFQKQLAARAENRPKDLAAKDIVRPSLQMTVEQVRLVTPLVATVDGSSIFKLHPGAPAVYGRYTSTWVKNEKSGWQLDSVRENQIKEGAHRLHLMSLDWMFGEWVDSDKQAHVETKMGWAADGNYLERTYRVSLPGRGDQRGVQRIGWDPKSQRFRSWNFNDDGSFSQGLWREIENGFEIEVSGVSADGRSKGILMKIVRTGENSIEWQSTEATEDGIPLPDLKLKLIRKPAK
jgi:uncharacterized protein (TIGR02246 family)